MRQMLCVGLALVIFQTSGAQNQINLKNKANKKGSFYLYWGWNKDKYTKSDIHFIGEDYDFTLYDVKASEKPEVIAYDPYLKPSMITIPQYNFRMGYFVKNNLEVSIGADHMKYVINQNQRVHIGGAIQNTGTAYDRSYSGTDEVLITRNFLEFEHTDGLNYLNFEVNKFNRLKNMGKYLELNYFYGLGAGVLYPRSDVTLLNKTRHDEFHVAGYGLSGKGGFNLTYLRYFFIQTELKTGFINMPDIRTTYNPNEKAKQHFVFLQGVVAFGLIFPLIK